VESVYESTKMISHGYNRDLDLQII